MIRYYSAARPVTMWTRALDCALIGSFAAALPMTWLCDAMVVRPTTVMSHNGLFFRTADGSITAMLMTSQRERGAKMEGEAIGVFQLDTVDERRGWPLTTSVVRPPARLDVDLRIEPAPRKDAQLTADDPLRRAIVAAMEADDQNEALKGWPAAGEPAARMVRRKWAAWFIAGGVWWVMLVIGSGAVIGALKFGSLVWRGKRAERRASLRAEGKCQSCGYDMTGLEFNERCPECGEVVW